MQFELLEAVTDEELRARVKRLVRERQATAQLIRHLVELEDRH